ncbi:transporter [Streptomyces sp. NPDC102384]|uniref:transporter n=1 Tax=Streptomyces sp. NPDC102384 TaxID=3366166 RepID=UPI0037F16504
MSNLKVFKVRGRGVTEVPGETVSVEVELQRLVEANMETMLGIRFLATEYRTGRHGGRIDSLGLDENGTPAIVEYKRTRDEAVVVQALSYLCWLQDHHYEFENLVRDKLANEVASTVDWSAPRIVCVASAFTYHETVAVEMIPHRIDLVTYRVFGDAVALQLVTAAGGTRLATRSKSASPVRAASPAPKSVQQFLDESPTELRELCADLDELFLSHRDVQMEPQMHYFAYRRFKNIATVRVQPRRGALVVSLRLDPGTVALQEGFTRDLKGRGNLGLQGKHVVEVRITTRQDLDRAADLIRCSVDAA